jgi:hypothetical protein
MTKHTCTSQSRSVHCSRLTDDSVRSRLTSALSGLKSSRCMTPFRWFTTACRQQRRCYDLIQQHIYHVLPRQTYWHDACMRQGANMPQLAVRHMQTSRCMQFPSRTLRSVQFAVCSMRNIDTTHLSASPEAKHSGTLEKAQRAPPLSALALPVLVDLLGRDRQRAPTPCAAAAALPQSRWAHS